MSAMILRGYYAETALALPSCVKLAFHDADTDTDILASLRGSARKCRRVVQLVTGITSIARVGRVGEHPREEVGVGVGVVECELKPFLLQAPQEEDRAARGVRQVGRERSLTCTIASCVCLSVCHGGGSHSDVLAGSVLYIQDDLEASSDAFEFVLYDVENVLPARRAAIAVRPRLTRRQTSLRVTGTQPLAIGLDLLDATQLKVG